MTHQHRTWRSKPDEDLTTSDITEMRRDAASAGEPAHDHLERTSGVMTGAVEDDTDAPERCPHCTSWTELEPQIFICRRFAAGMCPSAQNNTPTPQRYCSGPVWQGPVRSRCYRILVNGVCSVHGALGEKYHVTPTTIGDIIRRKT